MSAKNSWLQARSSSWTEIWKQGKFLHCNYSLSFFSQSFPKQKKGFHVKDDFFIVAGTRRKECLVNCRVASYFEKCWRIPCQKQRSATSTRHWDLSNRIRLRRQLHRVKSFGLLIRRGRIYFYGVIAKRPLGSSHGVVENGAVARGESEKNRRHEIIFFSRNCQKAQR